MVQRREGAEEEQRHPDQVWEWEVSMAWGCPCSLRGCWAPQAPADSSGGLPQSHRLILSTVTTPRRESKIPSVLREGSRACTGRMLGFGWAVLGSGRHWIPDTGVLGCGETRLVPFPQHSAAKSSFCIGQFPWQRVGSPARGQRWCWRGFLLPK